MRLILSGTAGDVWVRLEPETSVETMALERSAAQGDWTIGRGPDAIAALRALADRLGHPVRGTEERPALATAPPRLVIVQRGESVLAAQLRAIAQPGVPIIYDRRQRDRRTRPRLVSADRRRQDRRRQPSATWGALRFLVVRAEKLV
jgi:hypothetical protein